MRRFLILTLVGSVLGAFQVQGTELMVDVRGDLDLTGASLQLHGQGTESEPVRHPLETGVLTVPEGTVESATCTGTGVWCPELRIEGEKVRLPVYGTVRVEGVIENWKSWRDVNSGVVQGVVRDPDVGSFDLRESFAIEAGSFEIALPRVPVDLRFAFPGAVPVYRWGWTVPDSLEILPIVLEAGGSLTGWIESVESELPVAEARVTAHRLEKVDPEDRSLRHWKVETEENGFFQLVGLEPGLYRLELTAPDHLPRVLPELEVEAGSETMLGRVGLQAPLQVSVQVMPPLAPDGNPWTLVFGPTHPLPGEMATSVAVTDDGIAEASTLRPGEYVLKVQGSRGEDFKVENVDLSGQEWIYVDVPIVSVEGTVYLGDDPLAATVVLQGGEGDRTELQADEDGRFSGWMSELERPWLLATVRWSASGEQYYRTVDVEPEIGNRGVEVEIRLPVGAVYGRVMDEEGKIYRGMPVRAVPEALGGLPTTVTVKTEDDGRFHLSGLDRAVYYIQAGGNGEKASEIVRVDLSGALPPSELQLTLRPVRPLRVRVVRGGRPVAGAGLVLQGLAPVPVTLDRTTGPDGEVTVFVPDLSTQAVVTILSPSDGLWSACASLESDTLLLELPAVPTGDLRLAVTSPADSLPSGEDRLALVTREGGFLEAGVLVNWSRSRNGARSIQRDDDEETQVLEVPQVVPGGYALTWSSEPPWELAAQSCSGVLPGLGWQAVIPGGTSEVRLRREERRQGS